MKLLITRRENDFHVCLENHPEVWECGKTVFEAVGAWILYHGRNYNVEVFPNLGNRLIDIIV